MGKKTNPLIPGAIIVGGLGVAYYWWSLKDKTPVGFTMTKHISGAWVQMPPYYSSLFGLGTFRKDKNSPSISSDDESNPLLVVMEDGKFGEAQKVKLEDLFVSPEDEKDLSEEEIKANMIKRLENLKVVWAKFGFDDTDPLDEQIAELEGNSAEAETLFGPMLSLQSHFVW